MPSASLCPDDDVDDALMAARRREAARPPRPDIEPESGPTAAYSARTLGALQLATPGCQVHTDPDKQQDHDGYGIGGVLVRVVDAQRTPDPLTGEIRGPRRAFVVWDTRAGTKGYHTIPEDLCGQDSVSGVEHQTVTLATYQMAVEYLKNRGRSGRKILVSRDFDLVHDLSTLVKALTGGVL